MRHRDRAGTVKHMEADKGQFDEVLRRMVRRNPQKTREIKHARIRPVTDLHTERRKNPYEGPLPPDYKPDGEPLTPEQTADVERQRKFFAEHKQEADELLEAGRKKKKR